MARILPLDELNVLQAKYEEATDIPLADLFDLDEILEDLIDIFLLAIANGVVSINSEFGTDYQPNAGEIERVIYEKIDGLTWKDRVEDWYYNDGTAYDVLRIAETEAHRIGNEITYYAAKEVGATRKTWLTMLDDRVRDTHSFLEKVSVGIDDEFYTYDGDHAPYPGGFVNATNNINCRCEIEYSR